MFKLTRNGELRVADVRLRNFYFSVSFCGGGRDCIWEKQNKIIQIGKEATAYKSITTCKYTYDRLNWLKKKKNSFVFFYFSWFIQSPHTHTSSSFNYYFLQFPLALIKYYICLQNHKYKTNIQACAFTTSMKLAGVFNPILSMLVFIKRQWITYIRNSQLLWLLPMR